MKKVILGSLLLYSGVAQAQTAADLRQIENYLNNMKTLQANFVQMASTGAISEGKLYIAKPSKIRMEYEPPVAVSIVGNGDYVVFNDQELDQVTNIDYEDIPATLILANEIKIDNKMLKATDFYKDSGSTTITLEYVGAKDISPMTLVFNNKPFSLKQWKIVDPQSVEVTLSLYDLIEDKPLDDTLFQFKNNAPQSRRRRPGRR